MAAVIVLANSAAAAAQELDRHPGHDVIWSQLSVVGGTGYASQLAPDYPFYSESANDFVVLDNATITHAHWWGTRNNLKSLEPTLSIHETGWGGARSARSLDCTGAGLAYCGLDSLAVIRSGRSITSHFQAEDSPQSTQRGRAAAKVDSRKVDSG